MYSLDINFLKDRPEYHQQTARKVQKQPIQLGNLIPVYLGVAIGLVFPGLIFIGLSILEGKTAELTQEITKLEEEGKSLDSRIANIAKIKAETADINSQNKALVTVFDQIRPWSAMLQDLRDRIPNKVQIETIKQIAPLLPGKDAVAATTPNNTNTAGFLEISGFAISYPLVNDFALSLGQSKFFNKEETRIITAELIDAPAITGFLPPKTDKSDLKIKPIQVVKYTIKTGLSNVPASDLIQELEKKGTVGLVDRLRNIKKVGVIAQ
ncbi:PilN domain-containing protein [Dolichospermum sp. LEGE 00240]|jgi:type IV pilus assembly protein PilN|uniref:PilN domain-containing protein n=1 Tax=Dolichospermum sp. LEGE 00240 TaxID=1828603 RepID=UPI00187ED07D|nr:PilN domain-containing protein [Dolichospermum sp. LEGE 00240]MDM3844366.1 PilN domain-containing protein [Aphanizomenon gracile PMC638.10]MDM3851857.1 PilN domain-containing protein [Aphanizomenon gracile PMC627.10]MDM3853781.1 PilN domain-containing protein [Aphanizomenon gracile PMC649.10]MDM3862240.1 PilN domain-containing protein [Aphanizomenon gracile PMC644.10]MBE9249253.1 PilN domain-containing protein [Dolichospermum sp. LEGE 00240]